MTRPGIIERCAAWALGKVSVVGAKRAMARGDMHEANHYLMGLASAHSAHAAATCDIAQRVEASELARWYAQRRKVSA